MKGFISAYGYALKNLKKIPISDTTRTFLFNDYTDRLRAEFNSLKINILQELQDEKLKELLRKLELYLNKVELLNHKREKEIDK